MTSSDREILISINNEIHSINTRLEKLERTQQEHNNRLSKIEDAAIVIHDQQLIQSSRQEMLIWCVGIGFALMAVVVTLLSISLSDIREIMSEKRS